MQQTENSGTHTPYGAHRATRICGVIVPLLFFSIFISLALISFANDIYAFSKPSVSATVYIEDEQSLYSAAKALEGQGVINNPLAFTLYVHSKGAQDRITGFSGEINLNSSMSYREILRAFSKN